MEDTKSTEQPVVVKEGEVVVQQEASKVETPKLDAPVVDEKGVPYFNRYKEMERKYREAEEKLNQPAPVVQHPEPVVSNADYLEKIQQTYGFYPEEGQLRFMNDLVQLKLSNYENEVKDLKYTIRKNDVKSTVLSDKPDWKEMDKDIDDYLATVPLEDRSNPDRLKNHIETAYWVTKGKRSASSVPVNPQAKLQEQAIKDKQIISEQPEPSTPSRVVTTGLTSDSLSPAERKIAERAISEGTFKDMKEYLATKEFATSRRQS